MGLSFLCQHRFKASSRYQYQEVINQLLVVGGPGLEVFSPSPSQGAQGTQERILLCGSVASGTVACRYLASSAAKLIVILIIRNCLLCLEMAFTAQLMALAESLLPVPSGSHSQA